MIEGERSTFAVVAVGVLVGVAINVLAFYGLLSILAK